MGLATGGALPADTLGGTEGHTLRGSLNRVVSVLAALVLVSGGVLLDYHFGFVPIPDSPGAWRRAASCLRDLRSSQEEADCFSLIRESLHHVQVMIFNKGGQELPVASPHIEGNGTHTIELQWRGYQARHDLLDKNNLSILVGE